MANLQRDYEGHLMGVAERAADCLRLRLQGKSFGDIAKILDFSTPKHAYEAYRTALDWANVQQDVSEVVQEEALKLDAYAQKLANMNEPRAIEVLVKVAERKAKLLGLDAPEKKTITANVGITDLRIKEIDPEFVANVLHGLDQISRPALVENNGESLDSPQADGETRRLPGRRTA